MTKEIVCKNCKALKDKWYEAKKTRDDKERELISLSRKYTKLQHINELLLDEHESHD